MNKQFEINVRESFRLVKSDIVTLRREVSLLKDQIRKPSVVRVQTKTSYIAKKEGDKVHHPSCMFGKKIKPKDRATFRTIATALNKGYSKCRCLLK